MFFNSNVVTLAFQLALILLISDHGSTCKPQTGTPLDQYMPGPVLKALGTMTILLKTYKILASIAILIRNAYIDNWVFRSCLCQQSWLLLNHYTWQVSNKYEQLKSSLLDQFKTHLKQHPSPLRAIFGNSIFHLLFNRIPYFILCSIYLSLYYPTSTLTAI